MELEYIEKWMTDTIENGRGNVIDAETAVSPECVGVRIFERPLIGVAAADDPLFTETFRESHVIGPLFRTPEEWLPGAKSVIAFFLPFTEEVRRSNRSRTDEPYGDGIGNQRSSSLWLHGRIEGQRFVDALCLVLCTFFINGGYHAAAPSLLPEFRVEGFNSNWSERHIAYAAGLGTFGLSRGLITEKGMAGRFGSVVTDAALTPTVRRYDSAFAYCTMCGACQRRCPAGAIDRERGCAEGKDQQICGAYVRGSFLQPHGPNGIVRYGCGKCQAGVPCEHGIPKTIR